MAKIKCPAWGCGSTNVVPVSAKKNFKKGKGFSEILKILR